MKQNKKFINIIETAILLFKKFGMKRVTVEEICNKSNVSKATFYKHFKNKNELIKYIFDKWFKEGYDEFDEIEKQEIPFPDKIKAILQIKRNFINNMSQEFIHEYINISDDLKLYFDDLREKSFNKFSTYLEKWQDQGHIRKNIKPEFIIHALGSLEYFTKLESLSNQYTEYIDFVEEIFNFFFYGILNERLECEN